MTEEARSSYTCGTMKDLASKIEAHEGALTADELAALLKVSRLTILRRAKKGSIPSFRVGTAVRFDPASISRWLIQMGVQREVSK